MDIPSSSKKFIGEQRLCTNISYPPTPLFGQEPSQPTLQIISYDQATVPTTPMVLNYDLQIKADQMRHIRASSSIGASRSSMVELQKESHYISCLQAAEKEVHSAMTHLLTAIACRERSLSTSSGGVVAEWVERLEKQDTDAVIMEDIDSGISLYEGTNSYFDAKVTALRVGCSCVSGCYKSIAFAEDLASRPWPREWVVKVEHRSISVNL